MRGVTIIADDYGLSPGVGKAIRALIGRGRIGGTGCMTLFPEWPGEAVPLRQLAARSEPEIGLHVTLTDFAPLCGRSPLAGEDKLPAVGRLLLASRLGRLDEQVLQAELDAQLQAFVDHMGRMPDFIDGHQHVHFLPQVRRWFKTRRTVLGRGGKLPWLRGAPSVHFAPDWRMAAKIGLVALVAMGFDRQMKQIGFPVRGPLAGFYDWSRPEMFSRVLRQIDAGLPEGTVVMCHPGMIDDVLLGRDGLVAARPIEFAMLNSNGAQAEQVPFTSP